MDRTGLVTDGWIPNLVAWSHAQPGERALVVADALNAAEGEQLAEALRAHGCETNTVLWDGDDRPWAQTPQRIVDAAQDVDVYVFLHMDVMGAEAAARFGLADPVTSRGGRALFLGFVDGELLRGELSLPQPDLGAVADDLLRQLEGARELHVRGGAGTDLRLRVDGRPWLTDAHGAQAGHGGNFPGGEVFVAPLEDSANGVLVADLTVPYTVEGLVDEPVTLRFEHGRVTSIEGGRAAELLRTLVDGAGQGADVIAELGIGFNPTVTPRGHVMLDEKAGKTAHVAIGRNTGSYGGVNDAKIHVDCIFSLPEVEVDGRRLEVPS
jgi:leucyl aminopeptidase (aminopeptidase T)